MVTDADGDKVVVTDLNSTNGSLQSSPIVPFCSIMWNGLLRVGTKRVCIVC